MHVYKQGKCKKPTHNSKKSDSKWAQIAVYNCVSSKYKESQNDPNKAWKRQQKVKQVEQNKIHMK